MMISINAWGKKKKTFDKIQCHSKLMSEKVGVE